MEHWKTPDLWRVLIDAWRATPNSPKTVQGEAGLSYLQVMNAFKLGWPDADFDAPPIQQILKDEQEMLRAAAAIATSSPRIEAQFEKQEQARRLARLTLDDEEKISTRMRSLAVGVSESFVELLPAIGLLARELRNQIELDFDAEDGEKMKPKERMALLRSAIKLIQDGAATCKAVFELERLRIGKPTSTPDAHEDLSHEEAVAELLTLQKTIDRAKTITH